MARFSRGLLQSLANPSYGQNLFTLGQQAGSAQAMADRRSMLLGIENNPVDLANLAVSDAARTGDPMAMLRASQARDSVIKERTQGSLNQLEASRLAAKTTEEKMQIEKIMERVAAGAGIDASKISGRTQAEVDLSKGKQREAISSAYFALDPTATTTDEDGNEVSVVSQFEKNVEKAGFGAFISKLKTEKARNDKFNADIKGEEEDLRRPLPTSDAKDAVKDFPPNVREAFEAQIDQISQPDFDKGETWSSATERRQQRQTLDAINREIRSFVVRKEVDRANKIDDIEREIRRIEKMDPSKVTTGQRDTQIEAAIDELMKEDPPAFGESISFRGFTPDEPDLNNRAHREMIEARATELAKSAAETEKAQTLSDLRSDLSALQTEGDGNGQQADSRPEGFPQEMWSEMTADQRKKIAGMTEEQRQEFIKAGDQ
jgi:hypothetical protein